MDEFSKAHLTYMQINLMCDGKYMWPHKGGKAFKKEVLMIICGNKHPRDIYKEVQFLEARFNII